MPDTSPSTSNSSRAPFLVAVIALLLLGAIAYYLIMRDTKPEAKIGLITSSEDDYWNLIFKGAEDAAAEYGATLTLIKSPENVDAQNKHIKALLDQGYDGIAISVINPAAQAKLLDEVANKTNFTTFDADAPDSKRLAYVGSSNYVAGRLCGKQVKEAVPDGGKVVIICGTVDKLNVRVRRQGLIDELLGRDFEQEREADPVGAPLEGEGYTIVATLVDNGDKEVAVQNVRKALADHPDLACVVGLQAPHGPAALRAFQEANTPETVKLVAFDEEDALEQGLKDGRVFSSILQDQYMCGYETVRLLTEASRGAGWVHRVPNRQHLLLCYVLTKDNLEFFRSENRVQ